MSKFGNYELSAEKRQLETVKYQRRMDLRSEFLKQQSNPHVHAEKGGGVLFDPAIQRYHSMRVSYKEHFKPNWRTFRRGMLMVVIPIVGFAEFFSWEKGQREAIIRRGEISYAERRCKYF